MTVDYQYVSNGTKIKILQRFYFVFINNNYYIVGYV